MIEAKKKAGDLTTAEVARRLFPPEVRKAAREEARKSPAVPQKRSKKPRK